METRSCKCINVKIKKYFKPTNDERINLQCITLIENVMLRMNEVLFAYPVFSTPVVYPTNCVIVYLLADMRKLLNLALQNRGKFY